jgi:hypothetical protein
MVNLYDSPAQAQFINTYVPIQFDSMYKVADKAQSNMDKGTEILDNLQTMRSLGSLSQVDNENWNKDYGSQISDFVDNKVQSNYDLTNPEVLSGLASLKRRIQNDPNATNMIESKANLKQAAAKADPQWGSVYGDVFKNYDTKGSGQIYSGQTLDYKSWEAKGDEYLKDVKAKRDLKPTNGYWQSRIHPEDVVSTVNAKEANIMTDPHVDLLAKKDLQEGKVTDPKYYDVNPETGEKSLKSNWKNMYAKDRISQSKMDATTGVTYEFDSQGAASNAAAETKLYHRQMLAQREKEFEWKKNSQDIVGQWTKDKQLETFDNKSQYVVNYVNEQLARFPNADKFGVVSKMFGPATATYLTQLGDRNEINARISEINSKRAIAQASGAPTVDFDNQLKSWNKQKAQAEAIMNANSSAYANTVHNEENKALTGKSAIFTKSDIIGLNTVDAPGILTNTSAEISFGTPTKVVTTGGVQLNGFVGDNHKLLLRTANGDPSNGKFVAEGVERFKRTKLAKEAGPALTSFTNNLKNGYYDKKGFAVPGTSSLITGGGSIHSSAYYVPADELTIDQYRVLKSLYGSENIVTKDKEAIETSTGGAASASVKKEYIPIPTYMGGSGDNTEMQDRSINASIVHRQGKEYYQGNSRSGSEQSTTISESGEE